MGKKKINIPQKGAARKWAARLKELGNQAPPQDLVDKINYGDEEKKKIAKPDQAEKDLAP
jgi:hypothetical protein